MEETSSGNAYDLVKSLMVSATDSVGNKIKAKAFDTVAECLVDMGFCIEGIEHDVVASLCCEVMKNNAEAVFEYVKSRTKTEHAKKTVSALVDHVGGTTQTAADFMAQITGISPSMLFGLLIKNV